MKVKPGFILFLIVLIIILSIQNISLMLNMQGLEMRLLDLEIYIQDQIQQTKAILICIRKTNPNLAADKAAAIAAAIITSARGNGLDPALLASVARIESSFRIGAVSRANARGLLQVRPRTFNEVHDGNIDDWRDNIEAGARYLRRLIQRFDGDLRLALAAYNCGPSRPPEQILRISGGYADAVLDGLTIRS